VDIFFVINYLIDIVRLAFDFIININLGGLNVGVLILFFFFLNFMLRLFTDGSNTNTMISYNKGIHQGGLARSKSFNKNYMTTKNGTKIIK
jgi:hypothetical protein